MLYKTKVVLITIVIFFYIYGPDIYFLPINIVDIIAFLSVIYLLFHKNIFLKFLFKYGVLFLLLSLTIIYLLFVELIHGYMITTNSFSILNLRILIEAILPAFAIVVYGYKNNLNVELFYKMIIIIALFQFIITLFMFDINFKVYMFETFMKYDINSPLLEPAHFLVRGFGLTKNHLFSFAVVQGLIVAISFYYSLKKKSIIIFIGAIFVVFTIVLNARSGLIPVLTFIFLFLSLSLFSYRIFFKNSIRIIFVSFFIISTIPFILSGENFEKTIENLEIAYESTADLIIYGEKNSTYEDLAGADFWKLPNTFNEWLIGGTIKDLHSDVGYIRNLHYGGLIYLVLLYTTMIVLLYSTIKNIGFSFDSSIYKVILGSSIFISFFILEIKGHIFTINEAMRLIILIFIIGYFEKKELIYDRKN